MHPTNKNYKNHDPNWNEFSLIIEFLGKSKSTKIELLFKLNSRELKAQILSSLVFHLNCLSRRACGTQTDKFGLGHFNPYIFFHIQCTVSLFIWILTATINFKEIRVLLNLSLLAVVLQTNVSLDVLESRWIIDSSF